MQLEGKGLAKTLSLSKIPEDIKDSLNDLLENYKVVEKGKSPTKSEKTRAFNRVKKTAGTLMQDIKILYIELAVGYNMQLKQENPEIPFDNEALNNLNEFLKIDICQLENDLDCIRKAAEYTVIKHKKDMRSTSKKPGLHFFYFEAMRIFKELKGIEPKAQKNFVEYIQNLFLISGMSKPGRKRIEQAAAEVHKMTK